MEENKFWRPKSPDVVVKSKAQRAKEKDEVSLSLSLWMCVCLSLRDLSLSMFVYAPLVRYDTCLYGGATISRLLKVSFSKESYKRDCILQKRHVILKSLLRYVPLVRMTYVDRGWLRLVGSLK